MTNAEVPAKQSSSQTFRQVMQDAWRAILLDKEVFAPYVTDDHPFRRGAKIMTLIALPIGLAAGVGVLLDLLTMPLYNELQTGLYSFFSGFPMVTQLAANLGLNFTNLYNFAWWLARFTGGYPSPSGILIAPNTTILDLLFTWWLFGLLIQMVGGWLGGKTPKGGLYPVMALAFAPSLLYLLNVIPGLAVPSALVRTWTILAAYQAVRRVYGFSWIRSVMTIILTFLLNYVFLFLAVVGGVLVGVLVYSALF
jgi:hypothetical protein